MLSKPFVRKSGEAEVAGQICLGFSLETESDRNLFALSKYQVRIQRFLQTTIAGEPLVAFPVFPSEGFFRFVATIDAVPGRSNRILRRS